MYQLLAGGLIALTPQLVSTRPASSRAGARRSRVGRAASALVVLGTSSFTLSPITRGIASWSCHGGADRRAGARHARRRRGRRAVEPRVAYLGRISYGTYLWHWPIIVVLTRKIDPGGIGCS